MPKAGTIGALRDAAKAVGKTRFCTGSPCKIGHVSERFTGSTRCVECARIHGAKDYAKKAKDIWSAEGIIGNAMGRK